MAYTRCTIYIRQRSGITRNERDMILTISRVNNRVSTYQTHPLEITRFLILGSLHTRCRIGQIITISDRTEYIPKIFP